MLRIHCVQLFYNLSDPGMEDMLYEIESVRRFVGLRLSGPLPDETTILNFRHLLEEHELGQGLFEEINRHLESQGLRLREGTIVDASIIEAPSSTKNRSGKRAEMRQTKKGNEWHFGMKVHIGADAETGVVHSTTPANVHDVTEAHRLLHGGENRVWGDAGYQGVDKRLENRESDVEWLVAMRPGRRRQLEPGSYEALMEKRKASTRAKVEHPFLYVKRHFGYAKVRYRGLAKNTQRLMLLLGMTNLITTILGILTWAKCAQTRKTSGDTPQQSRFSTTKPLSTHRKRKKHLGKSPECPSHTRHTQLFRDSLALLKARLQRRGAGARAQPRGFPGSWA